MDVGGAIYLADRNIPRGSGAGALRLIRILIPLRDPDRFDSVSLTRLLRELVSDRVIFRFVRSSASEEREPEPEMEDVPENTTCLISGGVDSLGGAVRAINEGLAPLLVSHYTSESLPAREVADALNVYSGDTLRHALIGTLAVRGQRITELQPDTSMRLRSFLYLSLAGVVSSRLGIRRLWMTENGILTPGIPFSPSRVGPYTTRTTHPEFVDNYGTWFTGVTGHSLQIRNPHAFSTKAEILLDIRDQGVADVLRSTVSCFRRQYALRQGVGHCGYCVPCMIRRTAFIYCDMEGYDDPRGYLANLFDVEELPPSGKVDLVDMVSFCRDFLSLPENQLRFRHVDLLNLGTETAISDSIDTLRRFANEFLGVLSARGSNRLKELAGLD